MSKELFTAIDQHDASRVKALLAGGADPNEPQAQWPGLRPLHVAIPMMRLLLDSGADPEAPDEDDRPARDRLPPRGASDSQIWDAAFELLRGAQGRNP